MQKLNLPEYNFRIRQQDGKPRIFDVIRKKYVMLTPEEWVRQNFIRYLAEEKAYPETLIAIEKGMHVIKRAKRTDIVVYNRMGNPLVIVECKAPDVKITKEVFDQIVRYNMTLNATYLIVTNGLNHYCCLLNYTNNTYSFLEEIPDFQILK
jgi:hypothetical protein